MGKPSNIRINTKNITKINVFKRKNSQEIIVHELQSQGPLFEEMIRI